MRRQDTYRYTLKPYRTPADRITCPSCGQKRCFSPYINTDTGEILHPIVGRCDHEKKCGYHYKPSEFFSDNPTYEDGEYIKPRMFDKHRAETATDYLPINLIEGEDKGREQNNLYRFFCNHFGKDAADYVFDRYNVRTSKYFRNAGGLATAFPQIDQYGRLRQLKIMAYNPETGRRLKAQDTAEKWSYGSKRYYTPKEPQDKIYFAGKAIIKNGRNDYEPNIKQCLFGEHLIKQGVTVSIVESEKTALICALYVPSVVWVATGGKNGARLTEDSIREVFGCVKSVVLYPDLGAFEDWTRKKDLFMISGVTCGISDILERNATDEDRAKGLDIGDYLLKQPYTRETPRNEPKSDETAPREDADNVGTIRAHIAEDGRLYIPTPPTGDTYTVYQSLKEFEDVRAGRTNGHSRGQITRDTNIKFAKVVYL